MGEINAGVVAVTKFCTANNDKFIGYIDYIDRDEATRKINITKFDIFDGYLEYMDNAEKTGMYNKGHESDLFTKFNNKLSKEEKNILKEQYKKAQKSDSNMWQTVISFDNRYLEKNGIYNKEDNTINEKRLISIARNGITKMLAAEGLENAIWSASIHYNTDNIHIHVATAEVKPERERKLYPQWERNENGKFIKKLNPKTGKYEKVPLIDKNGKQIYKEEFKGAFKARSIKLLKQSIVKELETDKSANIETNKLLRDIVKSKANMELMQEPDFVNGLKNIYAALKEKASLQKVYRNNWTYNRNALADLKPQIDDLSTLYIEKYHKDDFKALKLKLEDKESKYEESYGGYNNYAENKINELYERLGNSILKELRNYDKIIMKKYNDVLSTNKYFEPNHKEYNIDKGIESLKALDKEGNTFATNKLGLLYFSGKAGKINISKAKYYFKKSERMGDPFGAKMRKVATLRNANNFLNKNNYGTLIHSDLNSATWHLRRSMQDDYTKFRNMAEFERLQAEIQQRGEDI